MRLYFRDVVCVAIGVGLTLGAQKAYEIYSNKKEKNIELCLEEPTVHISKETIEKALKDPTPKPEGPADILGDTEYAEIVDYSKIAKDYAAEEDEDDISEVEEIMKEPFFITEEEFNDNDNEVYGDPDKIYNEVFLVYYQDDGRIVDEVNDIELRDPEVYLGHEFMADPMKAFKAQEDPDFVHIQNDTSKTLYEIYRDWSPKAYMEGRNEG